MLINIWEILKKWTNIGQPIGLTGFVTHAIEEAREDVQFLQDGISKLYAAGADESDVAETRAALVYEKVESEGKSPDDFWAGLTEEQKAELKFSPDAVRRSINRTRFLGIASAVLFVGAFLATMVAFKRGMPVTLKAFEEIRKAKAAGEGVAKIMAIIEETKLVGIQRLWIPSAVAGLLGAGGWLTSSMTNNLNDVDFWGRNFLNQAEQDFIEQKNALEKMQSGGSGSSYQQTPRTNVTSNKTAKPKLFTGIFYSGTFGDFKQFERKQDDFIDSLGDMLDDLEINLKNWYLNIPNQLSYELVVVSSPKDEHGNTRPGTWVVCNTYITNSWHKRMLLENILLGPVNPAVYYPDSQATYSINISVPEILKFEDIKSLGLPTGKEWNVDTSGNKVTEFFGGYGSNANKGGNSPTASGGGTGSSSAQTDTPPPKQEEKPKPAPEPEIPNVNIDVGGRGKIVNGKVFNDLAIAVRDGTMTLDAAWDVLTTHMNGERYDMAKDALHIAAFGFSTMPSNYPNFRVPSYRIVEVAKPTPSPTQTATTTTPPVSQGANLVQSFPRTVVVKVNGLAVRSAPNTSAPLAGSQRLNAGETFVATALVVGEKVEGIDLWYKSQFGNFVWSGGTK